MTEPAAGEGRQHYRTVVVIDALPLRQAEVEAFLQGWADGQEVVLRTTASIVDQPDLARASIVIINVGGLRFDDTGVLSLVRNARNRAPDVPVVILSDSDAPEDVVAACNEGVRGFIPNSTAPGVALRALTFILNGGNFFPPTALLQSERQQKAEKVTRLPIPRQRAPGENGGTSNGNGHANSWLTERQQKVYELLCRGERNREIARLLNLTEASVKVHVRQIIRKLGVTNRTEAALMFRSRTGQET